MASFWHAGCCLPRSAVWPTLGDDQIRIDAHLLLRTQHDWIRARLDAVVERGDELPPDLLDLVRELGRAVRTEMREEEGTLLPWVEARSCRALAHPGRVAALIDELRAGHLRLDDLAERLRGRLPKDGPLADEVRGVLADLAEHHLEEASRLFDALPRLARDLRGEAPVRGGRRGTRLARNRTHEPG